MSDYDFLETASKPSDNVIKHVSEMCEHLKQLKIKMVEAEALFESAKKEYEHYANTVLPNEMFNAGIVDMTLVTGGRVTVEHNYYCQPNKNDDDMAVMAEWLNAHGGGHLVKEQCLVDKLDANKLDDNNIPHIDKRSINTNSLKAFLKDKLGLSNGTQQINIDDIPKCMHFSDVITTKIEM
jgi:hypothetical protein